MLCFGDLIYFSIRGGDWGGIGEGETETGDGGRGRGRGDGDGDGDEGPGDGRGNRVLPDRHSDVMLGSRRRSTYCTRTVVVRLRFMNQQPEGTRSQVDRVRK